MSIFSHLNHISGQVKFFLTTIANALQMASILYASTMVGGDFVHHKLSREGDFVHHRGGILSTIDARMHCYQRLCALSKVL
jgi:hypothetical protein